MKDNIFFNTLNEKVKKSFDIDELYSKENLNEIYKSISKQFGFEDILFQIEKTEQTTPMEESKDIEPIIEEEVQTINHLELFNEHIKSRVPINYFLNEFNVTSNFEEESLKFLKAITEQYNDYGYFYYYNVFKEISENLFNKIKLDYDEKEKIKDLVAVHAYNLNLKLIRDRHFDEARDILNKYIKRHNTKSLFNIQSLLVKYRVSDYLTKSSYEKVDASYEYLKEIEEKMVNVKNIDYKVSVEANEIFNLISNEKTIKVSVDKTSNEPIKTRGIIFSMFIGGLMLGLLYVLNWIVAPFVAEFIAPNQNPVIVTFLSLTAIYIVALLLSKLFRSTFAFLIYVFVNVFTTLMGLALDTTINNPIASYFSKLFLSSNSFESYQFLKESALNISVDYFEVGHAIFSILIISVVMILVLIQKRLVKSTRFSEVSRVVFSAVFLVVLLFSIFSLYTNGYHLVTFDLSFSIVPMIIYNLTMIMLMISILIVFKMFNIKNKYFKILLYTVVTIFAIVPNLFLLDLTNFPYLATLLTVISRIVIPVLFVSLVSKVLGLSNEEVVLE